jgi:hypothetical protein
MDKILQYERRESREKPDDNRQNKRKVLCTNMPFTPLGKTDKP